MDLFERQVFQFEPPLRPRGTGNRWLRRPATDRMGDDSTLTIVVGLDSSFTRRVRLGLNPARWGSWRPATTLYLMPEDAEMLLVALLKALDEYKQETS